MSDRQIKPSAKVGKLAISKQALETLRMKEVYLVRELIAIGKVDPDFQTIPELGESDRERIKRTVEASQAATTPHPMKFAIFLILLAANLGLTYLFASGQLQLAHEARFTWILYVLTGLLGTYLCFGLLDSSGAFATRSAQGELKLGGALVGGLLIALGGGLYEQNFHTPETFDFKVYLHQQGSDELAQIEGTLLLKLAGTDRTRAINRNYSVTFEEIPASHSGDDVMFELLSDEYEIVPEDKRGVISSSSGRLSVRKKDPMNEPLPDRAGIEILRRELMWDLTEWQTVRPEDRKTKKVSVVTARTTIELVKTDSSVVRYTAPFGTTSGIKPDFTSATHGFEETLRPPNENISMKMDRWYALLDISEAPPHSVETIRFEVDHYNGFQGKDYEWAVTPVEHPTRELVFKVKLPKSKSFDTFELYHYPRVETSAKKRTFDNPDAAIDDDGMLTWKIHQPRIDWSYRIDWTW